MRNWFWLRSYHPFSLFTMLQPTYSSTKIVLRQLPSAFSPLATSDCSFWMWSLAAGAGGCSRSQPSSSSKLEPSTPALCSPMTACLQHPLLCGYKIIAPLSAPLPPRSLTQEWPSHSSQDSNGNSCSSGIRLKIHLLKKYLTFSLTLPESYVHLPCLPPLLALKLILFYPPHLL